MSKKTALVISAHAADFVWRAGGAIALHQAKGYEVTIVCLSYGERGESAKIWKEPGVTLDNTLGAFFLGVSVSSMFVASSPVSSFLIPPASLFGVSSLQVYFYYHFYPDDGLLHKVAVAVLWCLDALHLSLSIYCMYHYGVSGFGNFLGLLEVITPFKVSTNRPIAFFH